MRVIPPLVALMLVASTVAPAFAADEARPTATVRYGDLDLRSEAGVRNLRVRINDAALAVCVASGFYKAGPTWSPEARQCQHDAAKTAEPRLQLAVAEARGAQLASTRSETLAVVGGR
jgi:UrcA family protein